jgi:SAM-dependent methyltransferase
MEEETKSIHDFDFDLICEYFSSLERQGPGSPEATLKALGFVEGLSDESRIADIGCGTGGQTMVLAGHAPGQVVGIDLFPAFIDLFNANARMMQLEDRVTGVVGSMEAMPFAEESLDLIWSEGAIYNIGFVRGLTEWRRFLKPGGYIAVSEASWFTNDRPAEIDGYWKTAYPEIDTIPNKVAQMQDAGYVPVASFILSETCWIDHFYAPQRRAQEIFLEKHRDSKAAAELVANERREAEMYLKYKAFYGYAFYIGRKR